MSILVVGSVAFDTVETPAGRAEQVLGGSASYFSVAASFFAPVQLVAVVGEDFSDDHRAIFRSRGIDIEGLSQASGKTFRWSGVYGKDLNQRETLSTELNVFETFRPELLGRHKNCAFLFLANIDPDLQRSVLRQMQRPRLVACDTMNFWIEGKLESLRKTLEEVDVLIINDDESGLLTGESNIVRGAKKLLDLGPKSLIVKRGEHGATLFTGSSPFVAPAYPLADPVDPTGAGDSFAGGFLGYLARTGQTEEKNLRQAVVVGSVMASFCVEDFGLRRFERLRPEDIQTRIRDFRRLTEFEDPE